MADYTSEAQAALRNAAQTGNNVAGMNDLDRADLARKLSAYSTTAAPARDSRPKNKSPYRESWAVRPGGSTPAADEEAARVAAELQRTERRIETRVSAAAVGRGARLSSRAGRLERKLRRLS